jgi:uncharacterized coiled-coil protein SlyX
MRKEILESKIKLKDTKLDKILKESEVERKSLFAVQEKINILFRREDELVKELHISDQRISNTLKKLELLKAHEIRCENIEQKLKVQEAKRIELELKINFIESEQSLKANSIDLLSNGFSQLEKEVLKKERKLQNKKLEYEKVSSEFANWILKSKRYEKEIHSLDLNIEKLDHQLISLKDSLTKGIELFEYAEKKVLNKNDEVNKRIEQLSELTKNFDSKENELNTRVLALEELDDHLQSTTLEIEKTEVQSRDVEDKLLLKKDEFKNKNLSIKNLEKELLLAQKKLQGLSSENERAISKICLQDQAIEDLSQQVSSSEDFIKKLEGDLKLLDVENRELDVHYRVTRAEYEKKIKIQQILQKHLADGLIVKSKNFDSIQKIESQKIVTNEKKQIKSLTYLLEIYKDYILESQSIEKSIRNLIFENPRYLNSLKIILNYLIENKIQTSLFEINTGSEGVLYIDFHGLVENKEKIIQRSEELRTIFADSHLDVSLLFEEHSQDQFFRILLK